MNPFLVLFFRCFPAIYHVICESNVVLQPFVRRGKFLSQSCAYEQSPLCKLCTTFTILSNSITYDLYVEMKQMPDINSNEAYRHGWKLWEFVMGSSFLLTSLAKVLLSLNSVASLLVILQVNLGAGYLKCVL